MAWTAPRTWVQGEVVTAALFNSHVRDNLRYLKGLDGAITFEDDIVTADLVDGVDVGTHESRHVSGGADELDSPLAIAAMPNLTEDKIWQGNVSNRPVEVAFPTKALNPANETVEEGYYAATTLSAVDADLAAANIRIDKTVFGFAGTVTEIPDAQIDVIHNPTERADSSGAYTKRKETELNTPFKGDIKITFQLYAPNGVRDVYGKIYRNGTPIGTERATSAQTYQTYDETFTDVDWVAGDLIQLYLKGQADNGAYGRNLAWIFSFPVTYNS